MQDIIASFILLTGGGACLFSVPPGGWAAADIQELSNVVQGLK